MNVTSSFPQKCFSSQVPDVTLTTGATRVHVTITFGSFAKPIYEETLYPDADGAIAIGELPELVQPFARAQLVAPLTVSLLEQTVSEARDGTETVTDNDTATLTTTVVYCTALVSEAPRRSAPAISSPACWARRSRASAVWSISTTTVPIVLPSPPPTMTARARPSPP